MRRNEQRRGPLVGFEFHVLQEILVNVGCEEVRRRFFSTHVCQERERPLQLIELVPGYICYYWSKGRVFRHISFYRALPVQVYRSHLLLMGQF